MKNKNQKGSALTAVVIIVVVIVLGYFLYKSSPQKKSLSANPTNSQNSGMDSMHGGGAPISDQLNSLVGNPIPNIQLSDKDGKIWSPADLKGKNVVLFFNEGLMCYPACWNQMSSFGSDMRFNSGDVQAISVVVDSAKDWQFAINKMPELAKATTMFDGNANASKQLGILNTASSMHRGSLPGHTYIVIDKEGIVKFVFDDPNMALQNDMLMGKIAELNK